MKTKHQLALEQIKDVSAFSEGSKEIKRQIVISRFLKWILLFWVTAFLFIVVYGGWHLHKAFSAIRDGAKEMREAAKLGR